MLQTAGCGDSGVEAPPGVSASPGGEIPIAEPQGMPAESRVWPAAKPHMWPVCCALQGRLLKFSSADFQTFEPKWLEVLNQNGRADVYRYTFLNYYFCETRPGITKSLGSEVGETELA